MNRLTDYGIVLLTRIASAPDAEISARELAEAARLPLPTVGKLLKILVREGLLVSHRGTKGGYSLSRPASDIPVAEIIRALEGPIAMTECQVPNVCEHESGCPTRTNWQVVNRTILDALQKLTLGEMTRPLPSLWGPNPSHRLPVSQPAARSTAP